MVTDNLIVVPVHNEEAFLGSVFRKIIDNSTGKVLAIDDGSKDKSGKILDRFRSEHERVELIRNETRKGYGHSLVQGFSHSIKNGFQYVLTLDGDGQHPPRLIPNFNKAIREGKVDIVSGSRYLPKSERASEPPKDHWEINREITAKINRLTRYRLTDAFCGYKIYKCSALEKLDITYDGFGMPLELLLKSDKHGLSISELAVPLIYDERSTGFKGKFSDPDKRLNYYNHVVEEVLCSIS